MNYFECRLNALMQQTQEVVQAIAVLRQSAAEHHSLRPVPQPVALILLRLLAEEEHNMRLIAQHLTSLHLMITRVDTV